MKIIGLLMFRNEERILKDTLDHMAEFCDMIHVFNDASTDSSLKIYMNHSIYDSRFYHNSKNWNSNRECAENFNRNVLLNRAKHYAEPNDWFVYMDADERIEFDWSLLRNPNFNYYDAIRMKLFDFYITMIDVDLNYSERKLCGPEYREIIFAFKASSSKNGFPNPYQREPSLPNGTRVLEAGYVKHYGKGLSVEDWEKKCDFYSKFAPRYAAKWEKRKGKAVHKVSSFGRPLIKWEDKETKGILLTPEIEKHSIY